MAAVTFVAHERGRGCARAEMRSAQAAGYGIIHRTSSRSLQSSAFVFTMVEYCGRPHGPAGDRICRAKVTSEPTSAQWRRTVRHGVISIIGVYTDWLAPGQRPVHPKRQQPV